MRVSDQMMFQNLSQNLDQAQAALVRTQQEASSGLAINQPSDNPGGTAIVLQIDTARQSVKGWLSAGQNAQSQMTTTDSVMGEIQNAVSAAVSLAVQATSGSMSTTDLQAQSVQAGSILSQVQSLANTQFEGRYVFSGVSQQAPVVGGTYNAASNSSAQAYEIGSGVQIPVSSDGNQVFNTAPTGQPNLSNGSTSTLLNVLQSLQTDLAAGNVSAVEADLGALQAQVGNLSSVRAVLGANMTRVQAAISQLQSTDQSMQVQAGNIQNVDMAQIVSQLAAQQTTYQAAVAAGANLKLPTLANYLP